MSIKKTLKNIFLAVLMLITTTCKKEVFVTGVELSQNEITVTAGDSFDLTAKIIPANATEQTLYWISNSEYGRVNNGHVTTAPFTDDVKYNAFMIRVVTKDGRFEDVCKVNVISPAVPVITINAQPEPTTVVAEGGIDGSLSVSATVTDNATLSYQWYSAATDSNGDGEEISGATAANFDIPATLTVAGSPYYYFCEVRATGGAAPVRSNVATVNVMPEGTTILPAVSTADVTSFGVTVATLCGSIINVGTPPYHERGFVYATTEFPIVAASLVKTVEGTGTGSFCADVEELTPNRTYYVRAYATNAAGTAYGEQVSFTTAGTLPALTTNEATDITNSSAVLGGNIAFAGAPAFNAKGVVYARTENPATAETRQTFPILGTATGHFSETVTGLLTYTKYYAQAYATNVEGTVYGEQIEFTTLDIPPMFTMNPITDITESGATVSVSVSDAGTPAYTSCGVVYGVEPNPTIEGNTKELSTTGATGTFPDNIPDLTPGTLYYARAYATNAADTRYGAETTFTVKKVMVGAQNGTLTAGVAGSVTFPVTTVGIANGSYTVTVANLPTGVTIQGQVSIADNGGTLSLAGNTATIADITNTLTLTIDGAQSEPFTLIIKSVTVGTQSGTLTAGVAGSVTFPVTTIGIANGSYTVTVANLPTDVTIQGQVSIANNSGTLTLVGNTSTVVGLYNTLQLTIDDAQSAAFTIGIAPNIEMVYVEGGTFLMGNPTGYDDEKPQHSVTLGSFQIGKYPVTQEQWYAVMGSWPGTAPSSSFGLGDNYPAYDLSWNDIVGTSSSAEGYTVNGIIYYQNGFCYKLSQMAGNGKQYRLPTEAEWEYAARGGNQSQGYTYSGSNDIDDVAWYDGNRNPSYYGNNPVGGKAPNELGIYDMSGNVNEWCGDWFLSIYYQDSPVENPTGPVSGSNRVLRGGDSTSNEYGCRVATRGFHHPSTRNLVLGFRLALSLE